MPKDIKSDSPLTVDAGHDITAFSDTIAQPRSFRMLNGDKGTVYEYPEILGGN